ncbi:MAG TPA: DeoR/GlpR family DNA-binding transcription regulator, partial [Candidatus Methylacidiphilales bacterium]
VGMVPHLKGVSPLTVVTNAVNVAQELAAATEAKVILLGGAYSRTSASNLGPMAENSLAEMTIDVLYLGTQAFDLEHGLTDTTVEIAQLKRAMIRAARRVVLLADSAKWETSGFIQVAPLSSIHTLVADEGLPPAARRRIASLGIEVVIAPLGRG